MLIVASPESASISLNLQVAFLKSALPNIEDSPEKKGLEEILSGLTPVTPVTPSTPVQHPLAMAGSLTPSHTPPGTPSTERKSKGNVFNREEHRQNTMGISVHYLYANSINNPGYRRWIEGVSR